MRILTEDKHNDEDDSDEQDSHWTCNKNKFWDIVMDNLVLTMALICTIKTFYTPVSLYNVDVYCYTMHKLYV